jgi:hypothetical protein
MAEGRGAGLRAGPPMSRWTGGRESRIFPPAHSSYPPRRRNAAKRSPRRLPCDSGGALNRRGGQNGGRDGEGDREAAARRGGG